MRRMTPPVFPRPRLATVLAIVAVWAAGGQPFCWAAETANAVAMSKTLIILKLDAKEPLAVRTSFQDRPPTITIEFPGQQVTSSLPERSVVMKGVVQSIAASYRRGSNAASPPCFHFPTCLAFAPATRNAERNPSAAGQQWREATLLNGPLHGIVRRHGCQLQIGTRTSARVPDR